MAKSLVEWCIENNKEYLLLEWDYEKNKKKPEFFSYGCSYKAYWLCTKHEHSFQCSINSRTYTEVKCPICSNKKVLAGFNDFKTWCIDNDKKYLLDEWNFDKNHHNPEEFTSGSDYNAFWNCPKYHAYQAKIKERKKGTGCPYCSNQKLLKGFNDFKTWCIDNDKKYLLDEWDYNKNDVEPENIISGKGKKYYWVCSKGHSYESTIQNRKHNKGCPYCSNKKVLIGYNDLETWCLNNKKIELLKEWDYKKNKLGPNSYTYGSGYKANWICSKNHCFSQAVFSRTSGSNCPICSGQQTLPGYNDIVKTHPYLAKEWDFEKNKKSPDSYSFGSDYKASWICSWCGKRWDAPIKWRTIKHTGCPYCAKQSTSFAEQAIYYYLSKVYDDAANREIVLNNEFDIYIPSIKTAVEYDGFRWHRTDRSQNRDKKKEEFCIKNRIRLISFRDQRLPNIKNTEVIYCVDGNDRELEKAIEQLFNLLNVEIDFDIDIQMDTINIISSYQNNKREKSIAVTYPELVKEWHPTKNGDLTPEKVSFGYSKKVWWLCPKCKNEYQASPNKRTYGAVGKVTGCPKCGRDIVFKSNMNEVKNVETGEIFESMSIAAKTYGTTIERIYKCCNNDNYTVCGFHWRYLNPEKRRRKNIKARIRNIDTKEIFENSREATKSVCGDSRNINACCNGKSKSYHGYRWEYVMEIEKK